MSESIAVSGIDMDRLWDDEEYRGTLTDEQIEACAATILKDGELSDDDLREVSGGRFAIGRVSFSRKRTTSAAPICHGPICCGSRLSAG
jgi:hypothetical protein